MKLLAFLLMHSMGKPYFFYHMQGYGNRNMSTARKSQCFTNMELRNWNFLDHFFHSGRGVLKCVLINSVISDPSTYPISMCISLLLSSSFPLSDSPSCHIETTKMPETMDDLRTCFVRFNTIYFEQFLAYCKYFMKPALKQCCFFFHNEALWFLLSKRQTFLPGIVLVFFISNITMPIIRDLESASLIIKKHFHLYHTFQT